MSNFIVKLRVEIPYPKDFETRVTASNFHTAASRAIKWLRQTHLQRRKVKTIGLMVHRLA